MRKVAINKCYGGFGLSLEGQEMLWKLKGYDKVYFYKNEYEDDGIKYTKITNEDSDFGAICLKKDYGDTTYDINCEDYLWSFDIYDDDRKDKDLIKVIEVLGEKADGNYSRLKIVEIPDDIDYYIDNYDGLERVCEHHGIWE